MDQDRRELVMFDFDGVIVDSLDVFSTAFIDACTRAGVPGFTTPDDLLAVMEDNFYAGMRARGVDDARVAEVMHRLGDALIRARHWLKPFPLVPQVLEDLADARTVVIVTSSPAEVVEGWLRTQGVHGVAEVAGAESGTQQGREDPCAPGQVPGPGGLLVRRGHGRRHP